MLIFSSGAFAKKGANNIGVGVSVAGSFIGVNQKDAEQPHADVAHHHRELDVAGGAEAVQEDVSCRKNTWGLTSQKSCELWMEH